MDIITLDPDICNGKPTIRGMRITVKTVLEYIAAGETTENILKPILCLRKRILKNVWNLHRKLQIIVS